MKKKAMVLAVLLAMLCLTGCNSTPYSRTVIKQYIEEYWALQDYDLAEEAKATDISKNTWEAYDKKEDLHFNVYDDYHINADIVITTSRNVWSDYEYQLIQKNLEEMPEELTYTGDEGDSTFELHYSNLEELQKDCDALWSYYEFLNEKNCKVNISYQLIYDYPKPMMLDHELIDTAGTIGIDTQYQRAGYRSKEEIYDAARKNYFYFAYFYRIEDMMKNATEEDIKNVYDSNQSYAVVKVTEEGTEEVYDDLFVVYPKYGISYGEFYELLKKEGVDVEGTPESFTFQGLDGEVHLSYQETGTCVDENQIKEYTGISLSFDRENSNKKVTVAVDYNPFS